MGVEEKVQDEVILSGMRPTGSMHLGNFAGALKNWVNLQEDNQAFYFVADEHALTTDLDTSDIERLTLDMVKDWVAFGVDPEESTIFLQSQVEEHDILSRRLENLINVGRLERNPTFKDYLKSENIERGVPSAGFLTYPVLMAADILLYKTTKVPVGEDQDPHVEMTRDIAEKFNNTYGEVFEIPQSLKTKSPMIYGRKGDKMSKSKGNTINPMAEKEEIHKEVKGYKTVRPDKYEGGNPRECPVYSLHQAFASDERLQEVTLGCKKPQEVGTEENPFLCTDCKSSLPDDIYEFFGEYREKRSKINDDYVKDVLREGSKEAAKVARETLNEVENHMMLDYL